MRRILAAMLMVGALGAGDGAKTARPTRLGEAAEERLEVPPPPFSEGIFPCSNCHDGMPVNRTRRELTAMHTDIVLKHDETHRWCLDCHDADEPRTRCTWRAASRCRSRNRTGCAASVTARNCATGGRGSTDAAPGTGTAPSSTCSAPTATIRISRGSARWRPSPRPSRRTGRDWTERDPMETDTKNPSRRLFTIAAAAAAASWVMTACGPKRLYEAPKERLRTAIQEMERKYAEHGQKVTVSDAGPMPGVVFGYALDLSRCIGCRRCVLRLRGGEQPVARPADPVDPRARDGEGEGRRLRARRPLLQPGGGARGGPLLHAGGLPAVRQPAVHQGLPGGRHLEGAGRHRGHRLRLVHRLPLLHGGLPLRRAPLQLGRAHASGRASSTRTRTSSATGRGRRASSRSAPSASSGRGPGRYPACVEICPVGARKFGNLLDPESEIRYIIEHKRVFVLKEELNTEPKFFYFYAT